MKNFTHLLLACCMLSCSLVMLGQPARLTKIGPSQAKTYLPQSTDAISSVLLGYCDDQFVYRVGQDTVADVSAAIFIARKQSLLYKDNRITSIHIGLMEDATDVSVFITEGLDSEKATEQKIGDLQAGWHKIALDAPYTITGDGFYIGYSCVGSRPAALSGKYSENGRGSESKCWGR